MTAFSSFTSIFKTGRSEARSLASDSYPELEEVLVNRPPPNAHEAAVDGLCALCNSEPATQEINGVTVGDRCAEHQMGVPGPHTDPPEFGQAVYGSAHEAGIMDWLERKWGPLSYPSGGRWSFDWCRYRHNSHCFYPGSLNGPATSLGGYPVFTPQDRGTCPRITWDQQKICPIGAPGPNSGEMMGAPDAISLQQQQNKAFQPGGGGLLHRLFGSLDQKDQDFHWHFMAKWADVRAKARRLRKEGDVRIVSAPSGVNPYIIAEVRGDTHTYQTTILRSIGRKSVASWECTCAWANYAWGRSGRWKKFEGRMCSHALATVFQAQADEMMGGTIKEVSERPKHFENPADFTYKPAPYKEDWAGGRPQGTQGPELPATDFTQFPAGRYRRTSALHVAQETEEVKVRDIQPGDRVLLTGYEDQGPHTVTHVREASPSKLIEPYEDRAERTMRGILEHDDPQYYPPKDYGTSPNKHFDLDGVFPEINLPHHAPIKRLKTQSSFSHERPIAVEARCRLEEGVHPNVVLGWLRAEGAPWPEHILTEALHQPFVARDPADELHTIVEVDGEHAVTDIGERIPTEHLFHPNFDWHSGLEPDPQLQVQSAKVVQDPTPHLNKDGSPHSGVMVALVPPGKVREGLAVEDGEPPEDMHVTVGYLGNKDDVDADALHRAVSSFAAEAPPLSGKVSGFGNFEVDPERNDGYSHAHIGLVDIPGIAGFRAKLDEHLGREGLQINNEHGLQPHLTVAYGHEPMEYDRMPETTSGFDIPHVTVAHGSTWTHYPLEGSKPTQEPTPKTGMLHWGRGRWDPGAVISPQNKPLGVENWDATHWEKLPEEEKTRQAEGPLREHGLDHETMVQNIIKAHRHANQDQKQYNADADWYEDQHHAINQIARSSAQGRPKGVGTPNWTRSVFGAAASLSPNTLWHHNLNLAHYMAHNYHKYNHIEDPQEASEALWNDAKKEGLRSYNPDKDRDEGLQGPGFQNMGKAMTMLRGHGDPHHVLGGHKVRSFFNNLIDPKGEQEHSDSVTTDRHHFGVLAGAYLGSDAAVRIFGDNQRTGTNTKGSYALTASATREAHRRLKEAGEIPPHWTPAHLQAGVWGPHRREADEAFTKQRGYRRRVTKDPNTPQPGPWRLPLIESALGDMPNDPSTIDPEFDPYENEPDPDLDPEGNKQYWKAHDLREEVEKAKQKDRKKPKTSMLHWAQEGWEAPQIHTVQLDSLDGDYEQRDRPKFVVHCRTCNYRSMPMTYDLGIEHKREHEQSRGQPLPFRAPSKSAPYQPPAARPSDYAKDEEMGDTRDYETSQLEADQLFRHIPHKFNMLRWGSTQAPERVNPEQADAMQAASDVQEDYADKAEQAQKDWYFNQPKHPKSFPETPPSVPVYMSTLPYAHGSIHQANMPLDYYMAVAPEAAKRHVEHLRLINDVEERHGGEPPMMWGPHHADMVASEITPRDMPDEDYRKVRDVVHQHGLEHSERLGVPTKFRWHTDPLFRYQKEQEARKAGEEAGLTWDEENNRWKLGMVRWAVEAAEEMLHDEPEGALPSTDGEASAPSELWQQQHSTTAQDPISAGPADFGAPLDPNNDREGFDYPDKDEEILQPSGFSGGNEGSTFNDLANESYSLDFTSSLDTGSPDPGANSRAWLLKGSSPRSIGGDQGIRDADIAAMARQFLTTGELPEGSKSQTKVAAKVFTPAEQQELIQEGSDGVRASNLDRLQLEGTHYLAGEEEEDPDLEGLFG